MTSSLKVSSKTNLIVKCAIVAAMAYILSQIRIYKMPQGGSVTLVCVPLAIISIAEGAKAGIITGTLLGVLEIITTGYIVGPVQAVLDYPLAYSSIAISALGGKYIGIRLALSVVAAFFVKLALHILSGLLFFKATPWYSFVYNISFLAPEMLLTVTALYYMMARRIIDKIGKI